MSIQFQCSCGKKLKSKDSLAGKTVRCPECGQRVIVRAMSEKEKLAGEGMDQFPDCPLATLSEVSAFCKLELASSEQYPSSLGFKEALSSIDPRQLDPQETLQQFLGDHGGGTHYPTDVRIGTAVISCQVALRANAGDQRARKALYLLRPVVYGLRKMRASSESGWSSLLAATRVAIVAYLDSLHGGRERDEDFARIALQVLIYYHQIGSWPYNPNVPFRCYQDLRVVKAWFPESYASLISGIKEHQSSSFNTTTKFLANDLDKVIRKRAATRTLYVLGAAAILAVGGLLFWLVS